MIDHALSSPPYTRPESSQVEVFSGIYTVIKLYLVQNPIPTLRNSIVENPISAITIVSRVLNASSHAGEYWRLTLGMAQNSTIVCPLNSETCYMGHDSHDSHDIHGGGMTFCHVSCTGCTADLGGHVWVRLHQFKFGCQFIQWGGLTERCLLFFYLHILLRDILVGRWKKKKNWFQNYFVCCTNIFPEYFFVSPLHQAKGSRVA